MAFYLSPQVAIQEVDLTTTIPAVATSIGVIVLRNTYKGPEMTKEPITSVDNLVAKFGYSRKRVYDQDGNVSKTADCYEDINNAFGYLKYGSNLYCTRVMPPSATFAGVKLEDDGTYVQFDPGLTLNTETITGDISEPDEFHLEADTMLADAGDDLWMIAMSRGNWGNNIRTAIIDKTTQSQILSGGTGSWDDIIEQTVSSIDSPLQTDQDFLLIVQSKEQGSKIWETVEVHNVSLDEESTDDQGRSNFVETVVNEGSDYVRIIVSEDYKNGDVPEDWVTDSFQDFSGGADNGGDEVEDAQIIEAYNLYSNPEEIDVNIFIDSNKSETVKRRLVELSEVIRKDSMAIVDVKYEHVVKNKGNEIQDMVNWRKGLADDANFNQNSSYVAVYGNWFNVYDKYIKEYVWVPIAGYMAGLYASTDDQADPWFAPAGLNRAIVTGVRKLAFNPSTVGDRDLMYKNNINPIVSFSGYGKVVWGQKNMLAKSSAFNRVNVRRLFLTLEKGISTASKWFLFEPNDRFTRSQIVSMIDPFLADVKSRRGIYDYRVICDETNNTPTRIDRNELWVSIFIKPTRTAEFLVLQFVATRTGASFDEIIGEV